jgi:hypothetical protein
VPVSLLIWLLLLPGVHAQDLQVTATLSADTVGANDQFQLTVTVTGNESGQAQTPRLPRLTGLKVVAGPSLSTQYQWINGRSGSSRSFIYILLSEREGQFTIDPIEVSAGNRILKTQPVTVRVTSAPHTPSAPSRPQALDPLGLDYPGRASQATGENVFMLAEVDRTSVYPGQQVTLTYYLFTLVNVTGLQLQENPPLTGFWVESLEVESKPTAVRKSLNGKEYLVYLVKKQALFPNVPGNLKIPPSTFAVSVKSTGEFFGFFGQAETVYRKTKDISVDVKPFPEKGKPEGFNNAVGSFTLTGELSKADIAAGDAVTLKVTLLGKGNLKEIPDLPLPSTPDLTIYASKRDNQVRPVAGDQIGGVKTWEYVVIPKVPGDHSIPPLSLSYFDPERERYETIATTMMSLHAVRGADSDAAMGGTTENQKQGLTRQGADIRFIKLATGDLRSPQVPLFRSGWFYILLAFPMLWNGGLFLYQRERARQSSDVVLARGRKARRVAMQRMRRAEKAGKTEARRFYDEAAQAFAGYLGDRFNLPEIAVTADGLERVMSQRAIEAGTVREAVAALQECDFARFVSASPSPERRAALSRRICQLIDVLERTAK